MRKIILAIIAIAMVLFVSGCGIHLGKIGGDW